MAHFLLLVALALGLALAAVPAAAEWGTIDGYIYKDPCGHGGSPGTPHSTPLQGATLKVTCDYGTGSHGVSGLRSYTAKTDANGYYIVRQIYSRAMIPQPAQAERLHAQHKGPGPNGYAFDVPGHIVLHSPTAGYWRPTTRPSPPTCAPCNATGALCGDPRLVGGDGIAFWFHGERERDFCIVSDTALHINAHFIGKRSADGAHDLTWVQAVGILFGKHKLYIGAQQEAVWDPTADHLFFSLDGLPLMRVVRSGGQREYVSADGGVRIERDGVLNHARIEIEGLLSLTLEAKPIARKDWTEDSCLVHLDLGFEFSQLSGRVEGVLGQTYQKSWSVDDRPTANRKTYILHEVDPYRSSSIFSTDCSVSTFEAAPYLQDSASGHFQMAMLDDQEEPADGVSHCFHDSVSGGLKCLERR
eukprot:SM000149S01343  [mRNA]  locus=s149:333058:335325:+ [translate_table: standard]